jgi:excisionase family DNA binding protein
MIFTNEVEFQNMIKSAVMSAMKEIQPVTATEPVRVEPKYIYSIKELAELLNCSIVTAQKFKNEGKIPYKQMGRKLIFDVNEVLAAMHGYRKKGGLK